MQKEEFDLDDDELQFENEEEETQMSKSSFSRRKLEEYMEMKRLKEFLDDDYDIDLDYEDRA